MAAIDAVLSAIPDVWGVITAETLNQEIADGEDLILIDVRTSPEVEEKGLIEGAISIPLQDLITRKADWPTNKDAKIVVCCGSGHRSTIGMTILWTYGYGYVCSLKDGFGGWVGAGYPVVDYAMAN